MQRDSLLPDRIHERLDQYVRGVRIVGGDLTRQSASDGTISVFGTLHTDLALDLVPRLTSDDARAAIVRAASGEPSGPSPELVVLPLSDGYHLAYSGQAFTGVELMNVYVDAQSGVPLQQYSDFVREVGHGKGRPRRRQEGQRHATAVGIDVSWLSKTTAGAVSAQIPHPFFFNRSRTVSGDTPGLTRDETAVHLQALWMIPMRRRWQLALAGGRRGSWSGRMSSAT